MREFFHFAEYPFSVMTMVVGGIAAMTAASMADVYEISRLGIVFPAASVVPVAKNSGARIVILNAEPTEMDSIADALLRGGIADILPEIVKE